MPYTQIEILAGLLVVGCVLLLVCQFGLSVSRSSNRGATRPFKIGNIEFDNSMTAARYQTPELLDYADNKPPSSLHELENSGINKDNVTNPCAYKPLVNSSWKQDMSIQIDNSQLTHKDMACGLTRYGNEHLNNGLRNASAMSGCPPNPSLGNTLLTKTELSDIAYAPARGYVTA